MRYPTRMSLPLSAEDESYVKSTLDQVRKSGNRINILFADPTQAAAFLFVASKEQMTGNGWLYIGTDWNSMQTYSGLDEEFREDMDNAVSIERRLAAMKVFHDADVRTTCFISPIFPEITDVKAIIERAKDSCNLIWLENLNLRGTFKPKIMEYIQNKHPELAPLYRDIYTRGDNGYWQWLDGEMREYAKQIGLDYVTNDDTIRRPFEAPPVIVNYFYHSQIKKSAKKR